MNKDLHCGLCFLMIWVTSGININAWSNKDIFQILLSLFLGVLGCKYIKYIANKDWNING